MTYGANIIRWYAKRAKLYYFFNKVAYQFHEMYYDSSVELAKHFANILSRLDVWNAAEYFPALNIAKKKFDYFYKNGIAEGVDEILQDCKERGIDINEPEWNVNCSDDEVPYTEAANKMEIYNLWSIMNNVGGIFEDLIKECDLPTYMGQMIRID